MKISDMGRNLMFYVIIDPTLARFCRWLRRPVIYLKNRLLRFVLLSAKRERWRGGDCNSMHTECTCTVEMRKKKDAKDGVEGWNCTARVPPRIIPGQVKPSASVFCRITVTLGPRGRGKNIFGLGACKCWRSARSRVRADLTSAFSALSRDQEILGREPTRYPADIWIAA